MKQILFDLDGTLTDSGEGIIHCAQQTLEHFSLPVPTKEELRVIVGPPLRDSFRNLGIKPEAMSIGILRYFDLAQYFDIICGAAPDRSRDTKSKVIAHLLSQITPIPDSLIMVGDTIFDIEGAHELGIPAIGVSWGYGVVEDMIRAKANGIANSMDELYDLINNL